VASFSDTCPALSENELLQGDVTSGILKAVVGRPVALWPPWLQSRYHCQDHLIESATVSFEGDCSADCFCKVKHFRMQWTVWSSGLEFKCYLCGIVISHSYRVVRSLEEGSLSDVLPQRLTLQSSDSVAF
jgi:hypothetical protein